MNKIKIFFGSIFLLVTFFMSYSVSLAADGCCIKDTTKNSSSNCYAAADAGACTGTFQSYPNTCDGLSAYCKDAAIPPGGEETPAGDSGTKFTNPLQYSTVEDLLGSILSAIQKIIVTLALVFITIGAIMILASAGSPETVEKGKKAITMALVGLALGIAAQSILKELAGILGWNTGVPANVTAAMTLSAIAVKTLNFLLGITGVLALIMLVIGAIMYLTSAGDETRIDSGKKIFKYSLLGLILVMSSMVIVRQIALFFVAG